MKKRVFKRLGGKRRGFTLIELLIVLSILAVLAAVVVLALTGFIGRGEKSACEADENAIQTAVYSYYYENNGAWPVVDDTTGGDFQIDFTKLVPDYLNEMPNSSGSVDCTTTTGCCWWLDADTSNDCTGAVCAGTVGTCDCSAACANKVDN